MKKYIYFLGVVMFSLLLVSIEPSYGFQEENGLDVNVNSNAFLDYVYENGIDAISGLCTKDFCGTIDMNHLETSFQKFVEQYRTFLEVKTDSETASSTILKGFPITKFEFYK